MVKKAFSLTEILVVVLIIAVISALLFPILARAKIASKKSVDVVHLGQCAKALVIYGQDNNETEPAWNIAYIPDRPLNRVQGPLKAYAGNGDIFRSAFDRPEGRGGLLFEDRVMPQSFRATWLTWEGETGAEAWRQLKGIDANPIVFRSYFVEDRLRALLLKHVSMFGTFENGKHLAVRADTSVKMHFRGDALNQQSEPANGPMDEKASTWGLGTDEKCPLTICDGQKPPGGIRF